MTIEYTHPQMNAEIESIGGHYTHEKETKLLYKGREVLAVFGCAIVDKSCCGTGGVRFAQVPGYIVSWKRKSARDGAPVSEIQPIEDEKERREIQDIIDLTEPYCQVNFL